jgi:hypothetical protein
VVCKILIVLVVGGRLGRVDIIEVTPVVDAWQLPEYETTAQPGDG